MKYTIHVEINDSGVIATVSFLTDGERVTSRMYVGQPGLALADMAEWCSEGKFVE